MPEEPTPPPPPRNEAERLEGAELPPPDDGGEFPPRWEGRPRRGVLGTLLRLLLLVIILGLLIIPFTPVASRIKRGLAELIEKAKAGSVIVRQVPVTREVPVIREVVREVEVPKLEPLPTKFVARKEVDVATLFNGITIETKVATSEGTYASLEKGAADAYKVSFQLQLRVPKPNQTASELARLNGHLPKMLPHFERILAGGRVSGFYHKLYENKVSVVQRNLTRLNRLLDRHNFFDCETILELQHPDSKRRVLLIQSEMDVVADGSDGDRMPEMTADIYNSDYYQPFTSYEWPKQGTTPNPLLPKWQARVEALKREVAEKKPSTARRNEIKAQVQHLETEIRAMKARSSLIAEKDPFVVLSLLFRDYPRTMPHAPAMGDYAAVIHGDKILPAICGDYGPSMKMGEASLFIAKTVSEKATPYIRGEDGLKVTYLIFPGTAERPFGPPNLEKWHEKVSMYLKELGGLGEGYAVHQWEPPKPKLPPETPAVATSEPAPVGGGAAGASPSPPPRVTPPAAAPAGTEGAKPSVPVPPSAVPPRGAPVSPAPPAASTAPRVR